ncbi:hypothetical protein FACS189472_13180 [Alphaproteobacteria bacterium]|nr:hypothetical protein FACS189472_13180 [Alphaproteobacteria bacterium]
MVKNMNDVKCVKKRVKKEETANNEMQRVKEVCWSKMFSMVKIFFSNCPPNVDTNLMNQMTGEQKKLDLNCGSSIFQEEDHCHPFSKKDCEKTLRYLLN